MALITAHFYSMALGMQTSAQVLLPEADQGIGVTGAVWDGKTELPVLYLLHGSSDDSSIWLRRTSVERYNAGRRLAIVMPEVFRSFYVDQKYGYRYYTYITEELPEIMNRFFRISTKREDMYISGLSMGGYGCMLAGLRNPEKYSKIASQSGLLASEGFVSFEMFRHAQEPGYVERVRQEEPDMYDMLNDMIICFGTYAEYEASDYNLTRLAEKRVKEGAELPEIMITIGTEDMLYQTNVVFRATLDRLGVNYQYFEEPGIHEWAVWDRHIQKVLDWVAPRPAMRFENPLSAKMSKEG